MHDLDKFWETLQEMPSNTSVQELVIHLSEFIVDHGGPEGGDDPSDQNKDQE